MLGAYLWLVVKALPKVSFPLTEQVPPAPVAGQKFTFIFSPQTFASAESLEYSLAKSPRWLQLDTSTRTLQGTPSTADIGTTEIQVKATDIEGSVSTELSLSVLAANPVKVKQNIVQESLSRAGPVSAPLTLSLYPQTEFSIVFGPSVFVTDTDDVHYFATSDGNTPLPAWISFDTVAVSFSGRSPTLLTPQSSPQTFGFSLAAGQAIGVSQATFSFTISVTNHVFQFVNPTQSFELAPGEHLEIPSLLQSLRRDGEPVREGSIVHRSANQPGWLKMNPNDLSFSGLTPLSLESTRFQLSVTDDQNNVAAMDIELYHNNQSTGAGKRTYLPAINATREQPFMYAFNITAGLKSSSSIEIDLSIAKSWLIWTPETTTITGVVPKDEQTVSFNISLIIKKDIAVEETLYLPVNIVNSPTLSDSGNVSSTQNSANKSGTPDNDRGPLSKPKSSPYQKNLALEIALPLVAAALLLSALLLILKSTRKRRSRTTTIQDADATSDSAYSQVSMRASSSSNIIIVGYSSTTESLRSFLASSPPPRVDLTWTSHQRPLSRFFSQSSQGDKTTPTTRSSWSDMLREVDNPFYREYYNRIDGIADASPTNDHLPPARTKMNDLSRKSAVSSIVRGIDMQKHSAAALTSRFNGRRRSGLGHGTSPADPVSIANRGILRQVPLSPLTESPVLGQNAGTATSKFRLAQHASSNKTSSTMHSKLGRLRSIASNSSRYNDPDLESSQGSCVQGEDSAKARWDDQDWLTMSNGSGSQKSIREFDQQGASQSRNVFPFPFSSGMNVPGEQSQSNSLRFI